jgi:beta-galactosidase/beta-glucuronidase
VHSASSDNRSAEQTIVHVEVYDSGTTDVLTSCDGVADRPFQCTVPSPKLWSPDSPTLYNISVTFSTDKISSYIGFRTISSGMVNGVVRPLLNGKSIFMFGTLDQGYWPDGLYTPPNRSAMVYDIEVLKNLGFNMLRKHVSRLPGMK